MKKMCQNRKKTGEYVSIFVSLDGNALLAPILPENSEQLQYQLGNPTEQLPRDCTMPVHNANPSLGETAGRSNGEEPLSPRAHEQNNPREKPHQCTQCGKGFASKKVLNGHLGIHLGELRHVCPECGKRFLRRSNLFRHLRVHIS